LIIRETRTKNISPKELLEGIEKIELNGDSNCCGESNKVIIQEEWYDLVQGNNLLSKIETSSQDLVLSIIENKESKQNYHTSALLEQIARILKPSGRLVLRETVSNDINNEYLRPAREIFNTLTLNGFVDSTLKPLNQEQYYIEVTAYKPKYEVGTSSSISLKKKTSTITPKEPVWKLSDDNDEIIDEDTLIEAADLNIKKLKQDDCEIDNKSGTKKACKNCTCGRADGAIESKSVVKIDLEDKEASTKSSCGNCYLGDAFRCSGCQYRGLPAFKIGEKITIS